MSRFAVESEMAHLSAADDVAVARRRTQGRAPRASRARRSTTTDSNGVQSVVCEEKHMGSRAVVVICRDEEGAADSLRRDGEGRGIIYTRTGRRSSTTRQHGGRAAGRASGRRLTPRGSGMSFETDWFCLDCELMPWSAKAAGSPARAVRADGAAARAAARCGERACCRQAAERALDARRVLAQILRGTRLNSCSDMSTAYRHYCWPVNSVADLEARAVPSARHRGAGATSTRRTSGTWRRLAELARHGSAAVCVATPVRTVDLGDAGASRRTHFVWWDDADQRRRRGHGREADGLRRARQARAVAAGDQMPRAASTCASSTAQSTRAPNTSIACAQRGLSAKRSMALREFALGVEGLERFVQRRAAAPRARMRLRRAGAGERTGRSPALSHSRRSQQIPPLRRKAARARPPLASANSRAAY